MFEVGQKLWLVPSERRNAPKWVTITKVGRKWLTLDDCSSDVRASIETLGVVAGHGDGAYGVGRVYIDRDEWQRDTEAEEAFKRLREDVNGSYTDRNRKGLTAKQIELVRQFIFMPDTRATVAGELFGTMR